MEARQKLSVISPDLSFEFNYEARNALGDIINLSNNVIRPVRPTKRLSKPMPTEQKRSIFSCCHKNRAPPQPANADFIFYTASSKSCLQPRMSEIDILADTRNSVIRVDENQRSSLSCSRLHWLKISVILTWMLLAIATLSYIGARYNQLDDFASITKTIEGYIILGVMSAVVIAGIILLILVVTYEKEENYDDCYLESIRYPSSHFGNCTLLETRV
ncbi:uncharacterized protein LOC129980658 isoform X2 [Argiope bruennichi]|uniref:Uncharacterized protein n=1 Tax=Argiope bruennichi TaxID=94029 RepID=A0A8T0E1P0_ARGBR|nr:uncharacterized protein LOC129980658 isoform X2 [Argiope bruennichi]KAF8764632.1 hypothetical protein HNY73_022689 [Argiope bruennichi]